MSTIFIALCCTVYTATSQNAPVRSTTTALPPYSIHMRQNLQSDRDKFVVTIQLMDLNVTGIQVRLRLRMESFSRGMQTRHNAPTPVFDLVPGVPLRLTNRDLEVYFSERNLEFTNIDPSQYRNNTTVPEDRYRVWFEVYEVLSGARVSRDEGAANMHIVQHDVPLINQPQQGSTIYLENLQRVIFQWAPRHFGPGMQTEYKLQIVEIPPLARTPVPSGARDLSAPSPEAIMRATLIPFFETTTMATSFIYDFSHPELKLGYTYAYRIQAYQVGMDAGISMFKNNGYTPTQWFKFSQKCPEVRNIRIEHVNHFTVRIHYMDHPRYEQVVFTRRLDLPDAIWYDNRSQQNPITETNLRPKTSYQYKIKAICAVEESEYSRVETFTTLPVPLSKYQCGAMDTTPSFINNIPLGKPLNYGDVVELPQGVKLVIKESSGTGPYKGWGTMSFNFVNANLIMTFEDLEVNELYQRIRGQVVSRKNSNNNFMLNLDDYIEGGTNVGNIVSGETQTEHNTENPLSENDHIIYNPNTGQLIIVGQNGTQTVVAVSSMPTTITDKDGKIFEITADGKITEIAQKQNVGTADIADVDIYIRADKAIVTFLPHSDRKFAFDQWNPVYQKSLLIRDKYEVISDNYYVPFKNIPPGKSDKIIAQVNISDRTISIDSIIFQTSKGVVYKPKKLDANKFELTLISGRENDGQELFALYKQGENWLTLGKLRVQTYSNKTQKVILISVNNATINETAIAQKLNEIYNPIGITWQVEKAENFEYEDVPDFFERSSGLLQAYTRTMREFQNVYLDVLGYDLEKNTAYLFIFDEMQKDSDSKSGFMPRGEQIGYIFGRGMSDDILGQAIAHELGHGVFQLKHPFDGYGLSKNELPDNLMDYGTGTHLAKWQWDLIFDPGIVMRIFERDGDAMLVRNVSIRGIWKPVDPPRIHGGKKALKYNRIFIPTELRYREYFIVQLTNGMYFKIAPHLTDPHIKNYALRLPNTNNWIPFDFNKIPTSCLSSDLKDIAAELTIRSLRYTGYATLLVGGIASLSSIPVTGGAGVIPTKVALKSLVAMLTGTWALAGGVVKISLDLSGNRELAEKMPASFIGTIRFVCIAIVDNEIKEVRIDAVATIVDDILTFNYDNPLDPNNILTIISIISQSGKIIESLTE